MIVDFPVPASPIRYTIELSIDIAGAMSGYIHLSKNVALCKRLLIDSLSVSGYRIFRARQYKEYHSLFAGLTDSGRLLFTFMSVKIAFLKYIVQ